MNVVVKSVAATESAHGVLQVWPVEVLTSAPAGSDTNSTVETAGVELKLGISKLGSDKFEQAFRAMLDAAMTRTRRMMVSVNSCGRRPHPQVISMATREVYDLQYASCRPDFGHGVQLQYSKAATDVKHTV